MKKFAILFVLLLTVISLNAQTSRTWTGSTSTDWNTAGNWSPSGVPSSSDHIVLNNGSLTNMPLLNANHTIANITVSAGTLNLNGDTLTITGTTSLTGGTISNGVANFNNSSTSIAGTTFGAGVIINTSTLNMGSSTFNSAVKITKNGSGTSGCSGGTTYNSTLDITVTGGSLYLSNWTYNNYFNDNVTISNTGSGDVKLASYSNTNYLASGKTISVGSGGFAAGNLYINNVSQSGTAAQTFTLTGSAVLNIVSSTFGGNVTVTAPNSYLYTSTFNGAVAVTKNGTGTSSWGGGITFNSTLEVNVSSGTLYLSNWTNNNYFNDNVTINNTGSGDVKLSSYTNTNYLASGKTIVVGSGGFAAGNLYINNVSQSGTTAQTYTVTGSATLYLNSCTFGGAITATAPSVNISSSTFNGAVTINKNGSASSSWGGGITFNSTLELNVSSANLDLTNWYYDNYYNGNVTISNTGSGFIRFMGAGANSYLASGKTITIGTSGFASGSLYLNGITQSGSTAQSVTLTGTASLYLNTSTFGGAVTVSSPNIFVNGTTFNSTLNVTKTSSSTNTWTTANTYNGNVSITNTGSGYINTSNTASGGDTYNANVTFTKSSSGDVIIAGNASTVTFKGDVTLNNISSTQFISSQVAQFSGTSSQTLTQSGGALNFGRITINKSSSNLTLTLSSPLTISTALTLTSGKIITTSTNLLNIASGASVSGASNSSFVSGPVSKAGTSAFTFPTGKGSSYRPIGIGTSGGSNTFVAEYKDLNQTLGSSADTSIANLSDCEYWTLTRSSGTNTVNVTLGWNSASCNGAVATNMRVVGWNGSTWTNYGNGSRTGTATAGTVTSNTAPTAYNAFTLSNKNCTGVATITPSGATSFCSGGSVTLTAPANARKYSWLPTWSLQSITASATGNYIVKVVDSLGCSDKDTIAVTVWPKPTIIADTVILINDTIQLNAIATGGSTPYIYDWAPGLLVSDSTISNPLGYRIDSTDYVVNVIDANGCTSLAQIFDVNDVFGNPYIIINNPCEDVPGNVSFCLGESNTSDEFNWDLTSVPTADCSPIVTVPQQPFYPYCFACTVTSSGSFSVNVFTTLNGTVYTFQLPPFDIEPAPSIISLTLSDDTVCVNTNASIVVNVTGLSGGDPINIDWGDGATDLSLYPGISFTHAYADTGYYPITVIVQGDCGNDTATTYIRIVEATADFTLSDTLMCPNTTVSFNYTGLCFDASTMDLIWNFGDGTIIGPNNNQSPTHTYTIHGFYTATVYVVEQGNPTNIYAQHECFNITVVPLPSVPIVVGSFVTCGDSIYTIDHPIATYDYQWSVIGGTVTPGISYPVTFHWNDMGASSNAIIITVSDSLGCSTTDTIPVVPCCDKTAQVTYTNVKASDIFTGTNNTLNTPGFVINSGYLCDSLIVTTVSPILINGTFTIDLPVVNFTSANIELGPNAKIVLPNDGYSQELVINDSWLHACDSLLWQGIILTSPKDKVSFKSSRIEDAKTAIYSENCAMIDIQGSCLNANYTHIKVFNCVTNTTPFKIVSNELNCTYDLMDEIAPFTAIPKVRTNTGVKIKNVNKISIGEASVGGNLIKNAWWGVRGDTANVRVFNNNFKNIGSIYTSYSSGTYFNLLAGRGIQIKKMYPTSLLALGYTIVGHMGAANMFTDVDHGVEITGTGNDTIIGNTFNKGVNGIVVYNNVNNSILYSLANIKIANNDISNYKLNGIYTANTKALIDIDSNFVNSPVQTVNITGRAITVNTNSSPGLFPIGGTPNPLTVRIRNNNVGGNTANTVANQYHGIVSLNNKRVITIDSNTVYVNYSASTPIRTGINSQGTIRPRIIRNHVYRPGTGYADASMLTKYIGINVQNGSNALVFDNDIHYFGSGLRMLGVQNPIKAQIQCNLFEQNYVGVNLTQADIGDQGTTTNSWHNEWQDIGIVSGVYYFKRVRGSMNLVVTNWKWYGENPGNFYLGTVNPTPGLYVYVQVTNTGQFTPQIASASTISCGSTPPAILQIADTAARNEMLRDVVLYAADSLNNASWYQKARLAYITLREDTAVMNFGTADDTLYSAFYQAMQDSGVGKLVEIEDLMYNGLGIDSIAANDLLKDNGYDTLLTVTQIELIKDSLIGYVEQLNDAIVPTNNVEDNLKETNALFLKYWSRGIMEYTPADSATLYDIAIANPNNAGDGVYTARAMLGLLVEDDSEGDFSRKANPQKEESPSSVSVYPNPSNGNAYVVFNNPLEAFEVSQLKMYDLAGKQVLFQQLTNQVNMLDVSSLSNGMYIFAITINGQTIANGKLAVNNN